VPEKLLILYSFARSKHPSRAALPHGRNSNRDAIAERIGYDDRVSADQHVITYSKWPKSFRRRSNIDITYSLGERTTTPVRIQ
jgi:hypothetical protein